MLFFIGDQHYGHTNIISHCNRPFKDTNEMDETLIENHNKTVSNLDTCFFMGDFAFKRSFEICQRLNGFKILIRGNHDQSAGKMRRIGFNAVLEQAILNLSFGKCILTHYPMWPVEYDYNIHGHQHNKTSLFHSSKHINVSCENINYTPISEEHLQRLINVKI